ncbi:MAG: hypothetical protein BZY82_10200 [SAR202 cluster bacterium Io17-Chloro-G3]|nr:MAG: hypothetical protein BZY82_10200 [SAR202 cluster bacterium Io17-Chloro-G3]
MEEPGRNSLSKGIFVKSKARFRKHLQRTFLAGTLLLVPIGLTYLILVFIYEIVNGVLQPGIERIALELGHEGWTFPGIGLLASVILIYISGILVARSLGVSTVKWAQSTAARLPFIGAVYSVSRQLIEAFSGSKDAGFQRVVMIQYPRKTYWAIGFLTSITNTDGHQRFAVVYIPTAPLPNSGWLALVKLSEVYDTDLSAKDAMQFVFSGGIVSPENIDMRIIPEATES